MNRGKRITQGGVAALALATCLLLIAAAIGQGLVRAGLWAAVLSAVAGVVSAAVAVWPLITASGKPPPPPVPAVPEWAVDRPDQVSDVVAGLLRNEQQPVGITTGLVGAGGFGKSMLALMVCGDRRVRRHYQGGVYVVTVGRDVRQEAELASKVNNLIMLMSGQAASFTEPKAAGQWLGSLLDTGPRRLLVLDDVWSANQLQPFMEGGRKCARLVTTRMPELLAGRDVLVRVDQMSPEQSRDLLTGRLPPLDPVLVRDLLAVTGRWPLLVRLVNKNLADAPRADVPRKAATILDLLRTGGPSRMDPRPGQAESLDVNKPAERARAARLTIEASTSLLSAQDRTRFAELAVFAEDETVPFHLIARLWHATGSLDVDEAEDTCTALNGLALVTYHKADAGYLELHDVIRDFLRVEIGEEELARLTGALVDAVAAGLPVADGLGNVPGSTRVAWWTLDASDGYLWDHLIEHLRDASRPMAAEGVACDLRWAGARLLRSGPAAPLADLAAAKTPRADRMGAALARVAHLLAPTDPPEAVVDIMHSRLADDPDWGAQVAALRDLYPRPRLVNRWPLPDRVDPRLHRVLLNEEPDRWAVIAPDGTWFATFLGTVVRIWDAGTWRERAVITSGREGASAVTIAPDSRWLVTVDRDGTARILDAVTAEQRATLSGVSAVAIARDGTWLAAGGGDRSVRIWDTASWKERTVLVGHKKVVTAVAIAPDGTWLATASLDGTVRIWDAVAGKERAALSGRAVWEPALAVAPDGSWLATTNAEGWLLIWDMATGRERTIPSIDVFRVAIAPDSSWLATINSKGSVRLWDVTTDRERAVLTGHERRFNSMTLAPDGSWLATTDNTGSVLIWDTATGRERAALSGDGRWVSVVAIAPDGSWLVTVDLEAVRIWNVAGGNEQTAPTGREGSAYWVKAAPDGSWLATTADERTVQIWDVPTGRIRTTLTGFEHKAVLGLALHVEIAPDSSLLATVSSSGGKVRIWDAATGQERGALAGPVGPVTRMAIAPDGSWLAVTGLDQAVRIWDVASGQERVSLASRTGAPCPVALSPDGSWLAIADYRTVRISDMATREQRAILKGRTHGVYSMRFAPDGSWLATFGPGEVVRIWDAATGRKRATIRGRESDRLTAEAVARDGSWLVTAHGHGMVRIWDTATGRAASLVGHERPVWVMAISADDRWLATCSEDRTIRIWDVMTRRLRALMRTEDELRACTWLNPAGVAAVGPAGIYLFDFLTDS